ncbi:hypothetical protein A9Q84_09190 [Halobacteriovorax marinus]|uniref:Uncharacterized protein n=1 Tax=Halobacteriovorax marinus TaxID=97084 RepID=A0A1Y5F6I8_9BACT|nr:hypothetical protein A9Q84_09190 [Halobacteriovorax marinus]
MITILILGLSNIVLAKSFERRARVIHIDSEVNWKKSWYISSKGKVNSLKEVVRGLEKSATGRSIIAKAKRKAATFGQGLFDILDAGESSLTDTTLIRKFSPDNPSEIAYETRSKVFLNKSLSFKDAVLDLAHELTHYSFREPFNPYLTQFTVDQFVSSVIEGRGGEVDAYIIECRVLKEIRPSSFRNNSNCRNVIDPNSGHLSKRLGVEKFYEVGKYDDTLLDILNKYGWKKSKFPKIGSGEALYISSAYGVPYPVAAVSEFTTIMGKACENDHKRLAIIRDSIASGRGRRPASAGKSSFRDLYASYKSRCSLFAP